MTSDQTPPSETRQEPLDIAELGPHPAIGTRGIYLLANDQVADHAIALLSSIRALDAQTPVVMIPFDDRHSQVAEVASNIFGASMFDDAALLDWIDERPNRHFGPRFFRNPGKLRKWACWFGPFEEFLYLDCDIVVLERIATLLEYLQVADFVSCDDQFEGGLARVFSESARDDGIFSPADLTAVFNAGLFASHTGLFSREQVDRCFAEAAAHRRYLDFSRGGADQPLLNFAILRATRKRLNVYRDLPGEPAMWAGSPNLVSRGAAIVDRRNGRIPRFVHWAGTPIGPGGAHWELWRYYRELRPELPPARLPPVPRPSRLTRLRAHARVLNERARQAARYVFPTS